MAGVFVTATRLLIAFSVLTGALYPLTVHVVGALAFPNEAAGSLVTRGGAIVGSSLLAQRFAADRYFHARPSAADYATVASGASNLGPTSAALRDIVDQRRRQWGAGAPAELLLASGSGLDPHLTPEGARYQLVRVAQARQLSAEQQHQLETLIEDRLELPTFGILGSPRVNVLLLNLNLDELWP